MSVYWNISKIIHLCITCAHMCHLPHSHLPLCLSAFPLFLSLSLSLSLSPQPVIFGAILHRDQAYQSISDQAMILGLNWGSDPESLDRQTSQNPSEQDETSQSNSN